MQSIQKILTLAKLGLWIFQDIAGDARIIRAVRNPLLQLTQEVEDVFVPLIARREGPGLETGPEAE